MLLPRFNYHAPTQLDEACQILSELKEKAALLAGGTDIIVNMKKGLLSPENLISLTRIEELTQKTTDSQKGTFAIGACAKVADLACPGKLDSTFGAVAVGAKNLGTPLIRNTATVGGNLITARPAADMPPSLMVYGADVVLKSTAGERTVPLDQFITGVGHTVIHDDEILARIVLNQPPPFSGAEYIKLSMRKTLEISLVNVAAFISLDQPDGVIQTARIVLGSVAPVPMRAPQTEAFLTGAKPDETLFQEAAQKASEESMPIDDYRGSAEYRKDMVKVLIQRALKAALDQALSAKQRRTA